ncbi:glycerate kinase [Cohnella luojiensis]|uniref:Glycerate kinase n=1 Tax=Cohnella luojiensis TaxID=652876 RepID=A0A4Y8M563_9BACL|nr:glycerate kinase [Cohnella luojiensis]TFE29511.1 glycerate kinase [Cohnella luojiensis]
MKFVIAPDSFKDSMPAAEAANVMKDAVLRVFPDAELVVQPLGDGGEGTMESLVSASGGSFREVRVTGPLGDKIAAQYALLGDGKTAVVELARASGLQLVPPDRRNPYLATTYGTGELILAALSQNIQRLIVTIGGSATNDAGAGMLQALGAEITDAVGKPIGFGGGCLGEVASIDFSQLDSRLSSVSIQVACDVTNPLIGLRGASRVFGPQKGATSDMIEQLENIVTHFADIVANATGLSVHHISGAGAAGGTGAALLLCGGMLTSGIDIVLDTVGFDQQLSRADYVLTGEGRIDNQTPDGKVIAGIVKRAKAESVPVIAFAGSVKPGYERLYKEGLLSVHSITSYPCTLDEALKEGKINLARTVENTMRLLAAH